MATSIAGAARLIGDSDELVCPGCTRTVRPEPPSSSRIESRDAGQGWSHLDGSALCWQLFGALAEPVARGRRVGGAVGDGRR